MSKAQHPIQVPVKRRPNLTVAPFEGFDRTASLPVPQELIDDHLRGFTEGELKVALMVIRATNGGQREGVALSVRALCSGGVPDLLPGRGTGLSARTVQAACAALETAGYLRIVRRMAPDGSGLPSLFSLPLLAPGMAGAGDANPTRFPGYSTVRRARIPLLVIDRLLAELSGAELKVLLYVLRHTFCLGIADQVMPMARLVENTGLSLRHTRLAVAGLSARGIILGLSARGIILVQHRQDPERGKVPSRFGVRVLGEPAPFSVVAPAPGVPARAARAEEQAEPARPVWLVPTQPEAPVPEGTTVGPQDGAVPAAILKVFPTAVSTPAALPAPMPVQASSPVAASNPPSRSVTAAAAGAAPPTRQAPPAVRREIPSTLVRDQHPVWEAVKRILAERLPYHYFIERVAPTHSVGGDGPDLLIAVQNEHHRMWMEDKFGAQVREALVDAGYPTQRLRYLNYSGTKGDGERR
jgi:hypothetical protein